MSIAQKLQTIAENERKVYDAGKAEGIEEGEEAYYQLLEGTLTEINDDRLTEIRPNTFNTFESLTSANLPNVTKIGDSAFRESAIEQIDCPNVTGIGSYAFYHCAKLTTVNMPMLSTTGGSVLDGCNLTSISFPMLSTTGTFPFRNNKYLTFAEFGKLSKVQSSAFYSCYSLTTLIIRTEVLCSLSSTNAFTYCHHILGTTHSTLNPTGAKDGYIYVPKALVDTYKTATNWVTYADQIRAIEDYPEITGG